MVSDAETQTADASLVVGAMADRAKLFAKMARVLGAVSRVPKHGRNNFHNYDYATEADLVDVIRPAMAEAGIAFFVSCVQSERTGDLTRVMIEATFADGESGAMFGVRWYGDGQDKADKGLYKAYTGAIKYLLMKTFLVSTGDDPEQDEDTTPKAPAKAQPVQQRPPTPLKPAPAKPAPVAPPDDHDPFDDIDHPGDAGYAAAARSAAKPPDGSAAPVCVECGRPIKSAMLPDPDTGKVRRYTDSQVVDLSMAVCERVLCDTHYLRATKAKPPAVQG